MTAKLVPVMAAALIAMFLGAGPASAQEEPGAAQDAPAAAQDAPAAAQDAPASPPSSDQAAPQLAPEQLDQLLAPVALYPDSLLAQILMAASYPLQVVQADRWLQDPNNAALKSDQLATALEPQPWDPSVKSLVPFPQILLMMDGNLDWTERLGDAFVANQPAVMESVQRLRERAEAAGKLHSTPQQAVTTEGQAILIEPSSPQVVYVPVYDPAVAYGPWPDPTLPPYEFPGYFDGVGADSLGFGWYGVTIVTPLWGWHHWDWRHHRIDIDRDRFAKIDRFHPPMRGSTWEHDGPHRHGAPMPDPVARGRFPGGPGPVSPPMPRIIRGTQAAPTMPFHPPVGGVQQQAVVRQQALQPQVVRPQVIQPQVVQPQVVRPQMVRPQAVPPAFRANDRGIDIRAQAERGRVGPMPTPAFRPATVGVHAAAPIVGAGRP